MGDLKAQNETQAVRHLVWEVAYQHWHRMLFARFLAESGLLLWEPGAPVSLDDCREMVDNHPDLAQGARSQWELAGRLAARMLPQVFKPRSPVFELSFAPEHQRELERLLGHLPVEVFWASDSLGWVYQFWQAKRKDEVNASEVKIGADELPAVTQLFTEPYMVDFLLHNSLGAWWVTRWPDQPCPVPLTYLRTLPSSASQAGEGGGAEEPTPAAGRFEGWPERLADFRLLDPCCGSGHFLVAAFLMLVPMRMVAEELSAAEAVDAVLRDNLHGLELDARCVEIAVFALALAAWRYPDANGDPLGVRAEMPVPRIACCGLKVAARPEDWVALVPEDAPHSAHLREGLRRLHETFQQAPLLGSLLDPGREHEGDLFAPDYAALRGLLREALSTESSSGARDETDSIWDCALSAQGLLEAAQLLEARYDLVVTNVPYLARGKQSEALKAYCERHYPEAKNDLANVFLERCLELSGDGGRGVVQIVMPQNWLFLTSYRKQRERLLKRVHFNLVALLGPKGFQTPMWDFNVQLLTMSHAPAADGFEVCGVDVSEPKTAQEKAVLLRECALMAVNQKEQLRNPDARIAFGEHENLPLLSQYADGLVGLQTSDDPMFVTAFWEHSRLDRDVWEMMQGTPTEFRIDAGASWLVRWEKGKGLLLSLATAYPKKGLKAVGRHGVAIHRMQVLFPYMYAKERFHQNVAVIVPKDEKHLPAIWCFCSSPEYNEAVRRIDQKLNVTNATLVKVPFDLAHWQQVAAERYPNGLPKPYSDNPTQWLFHGHPQPATDPLQVAVARLLGYRWPAETDPDMELADEARAWIARCEALTHHSDADGIVCLPSVRGEKPAHERLLDLLIAAWETVQPGSWKPSVLDSLLADAAGPGKSLETWLRDSFFEQHARRFHHRPFIWHVWDGLKDGFGALINYHTLDAKHLERLIHTYLGDWIRQQEAGVRDGRDGAETRLAAAQDLKRRLELILEGEAPYDIFVRWKPLAEQPIGWNPDLNDGVRLNIRPFMTAEVLRHNKKPKLNIEWKKDRGKDVESAPWFPVFQGERINDHHLTLAEKRAARGA
ncbi:Eco57I restriction-modification methylase domain-containing protein [Allochromatium vinosum]|uniref:Eco57I restriction-modification methylase domain-containing protein n=1 Tax=Allochromatium vinosum TaxID=1049 RepID=UPI0030B86261